MSFKYCNHEDEIVKQWDWTWNDEVAVLLFEVERVKSLILKNKQFMILEPCNQEV